MKGEMGEAGGQCWRRKESTSADVGMDGAAPGRVTAMAAAADARRSASGSGRPAATPARTGVATPFYRFPGGSGNTVSAQDMSVFIPILYAGGIEYYDWNVYPGDASAGQHTAEEIVSNTLKGVDKVDTAVIVLHDTGAKKSTVDALPEILEGLRERDCNILPFDEDTPVIHQYELSEDE